MRVLRLLAPAAFLCACAAAAAAAVPGRARLIPMTEVSYLAAEDLTPALRSGSAQVGLPFGLVWEGGRYDGLEVGAGWVRLVAGGDSTASEPRIDVFPFAPALSDSARVSIVRDPFRVALRWWGLTAPERATPLAAEIVIERGSSIRVQYLQVHGLAAPLSVAGLTLGNGTAVEIVPASERLLASPEPGSDATGPAPPGCVAPTGDWCSQADGPTADTRVLLDSRMEEAPPVWTTSPPPAPPWGLIADTTCPPGATTAPGQSAYIGDPATCRYTGAFQSSLTGPTIGPVTATTRFQFSSRMQFPYPTDQGEILINGNPTWYVDPTSLDPASWYSFLPLTIPATYIGQNITLSFRFTTSGTTTGQLGWMVDDVFVWDDNGANYKCVREAMYWDGASTPYADCADTVSDDWSFNETEFCLGCTYTFYALVECGTEMHLPLKDMEGAEIAVTDMITGLRPSLRCANDAFRSPPGPVVFQKECCAANAGLEQWTGPSWSATDSAGPGAVSWGFPACPDLAGTYDLNSNGIDCSELSPSCGGVLSRLSPGEAQGVDCTVAGSPGLCGIYRIDVRSGGFVWDLFANCTGDTTPNFRLYTSCADAWAAFNPLPELAISVVREVGVCPDTALEFTLQNLGCADHVGDIAVRATSDCPVPDVVNWTLTGGLAANSSRTEQRPMTVSCPGATVTVFVDPLDVIAECSESGSAAACAVIPGSDSTTVSVCGCAGTQPPVPAATTVCAGRSTDLSCGTPVAGATYDWDFEDDGTYDATGCLQSHVFSGPGPFTARVRITESGGCQESATIAVSVTADVPATEPALLLGSKAAGGLQFVWAVVPGAVSYRVARGTIKNFYDHTVDDTLGIGLCDTASARVFSDVDDFTGPGSFYYLVAPISNCGTVTPWGNGLDAVPAPIPTASCP